ncbi:MAG: PDZ domain-containing protein [bacterium]
MKFKVLLAAIAVLAVAGIAAPTEPGTGDAEARMGWLGVFSETPSEATKAALGIEGGVIVADVLEGSPAASAGLRKGDVITGLDGVRIASGSDLRHAVRARPDRKIKVEVQRQGSKVAIPVELGARDDDFPLLGGGDWTGIPGDAMRMAMRALQRSGGDSDRVRVKIRGIDEELKALDELREQLEDLKEDLKEEIDDLREELRERLRESGRN